MSRKLVRDQNNRLIVVLAIAAARVAVLAAIVQPVLTAGVGLPLVVKMAATVLLIAPAGFAMGIPFPTGLRLLEKWHEPSVRWAWSLNAAASVLGSVGALVLALYVGLVTTMLIGGGLYLCAHSGDCGEPDGAGTRLRRRFRLWSRRKPTLTREDTVTGLNLQNLTRNLSGFDGRDDARDVALRVRAGEDEHFGVGDEDLGDAQGVVHSFDEDGEFLIIVQRALHGLDLGDDRGTSVVSDGRGGRRGGLRRVGADGVHDGVFCALQCLIGEDFSEAADRHAFEVSRLGKKHTFTPGKDAQS